MIGLAIVTYNRPEYLQQVLDGVEKHLIDLIDVLVIVNDGSTADYSNVKMPEKAHYIEQENGGVAKAKNAGLKYLMDKGCKYLFIAEDDIIPKDRGAIVQYIAVSRFTGCHHLMFAHHGAGNVDKRLAVRENVYEVFPACVGAWCYYSRAAIEKVGYMDENFINAWEHVEHTHRIAKENMCPPFGHYMDVYDSTQYLMEIPGSIEDSSIRTDTRWQQRILNGLYYWRKKDPIAFPLDHTVKDLEAGKWIV